MTRARYLGAGARYPLAQRCATPQFHTHINTHTQAQAFGIPVESRLLLTLSGFTAPFFVLYCLSLVRQDTDTWHRTGFWRPIARTGWVLDPQGLRDPLAFLDLSLLESVEATADTLSSHLASRLADFL